MAKKSFEVTIPQVPNFIRVGVQNLSLDQFTVEELNQIAKEWNSKLLENRQRIIQATKDRDKQNPTAKP